MNKKTGGIILACILGILIIVTAFTHGFKSTELPTFTNEERSYMSVLVNNIDTSSHAVDELLTLLTEPIIGINEWRLNIATQLMIIRSRCDEAIQMSPPASMTNIHSKYMQAMNTFNDVTYLITTGIDTLDKDTMEEAANRMKLGIQYFNETGGLIEGFLAIHK